MGKGESLDVVVDPVKVVKIQLITTGKQRGWSETALLLTL